MIMPEQKKRDGEKNRNIDRRKEEFHESEHGERETYLSADSGRD